MGQTQLQRASQPDGHEALTGGSARQEADEVIQAGRVREATGSQLAWQATLEYWLECGLEFRSGEQLEFFTPPPRVRGGYGSPALSTEPPSHFVSSDPPFHSVAVVTDPVVVTPVPTQPPILITEQYDAPLPELLPAADRPALLAQLAAQVASCDKCVLAKTRTNTVFGVGNPNASVVFVGEGPGEEEDLRGEPFVGPAGKLFDCMLRACALDRSQVFIANVVKCRPPGNRNPQTAEVAACRTYLFRQLETIRPKIIFCLGKFAILCLTGYADSVSSARGEPFFWRGIPVIASYHPAYYLRTPGRKRAAWEDLIRLMQQLKQME